ncbi:uncharacterized protein LOC106865552 [Brachypodium distachyon]|uniref:Uncharacterized protein n=1 Tax=Brachypodium distachyon TaxID=15368 RepID=A0A0Q3H9I1_BRADI|nr:uncharacterized protein LOC106865552 [Brachypodium distachyon]XP_014751223.1 uncharacterized protein LOC106865552 [Brachypodium distachyon]XP_014751224.1 uncharacterized protein LOC106865552 [Brachypodium distachyon]KQJ84851.1 hypothetical protein BRADI_5g23285v3 [Brachypodium distachyon]PNT61946.1 hypothetical protein BRADI_5g23285v3 [Brachypodium distachyon]|eukprot:XP_014751222.1 uncharacterized protein LOC106865552 [Brachypodium distachyon]
MEALRATTARLFELARAVHPRRAALKLLRQRVTLALVIANLDRAFCADLNKAVTEVCDAFSRDAGEAADLAARLDAMRRGGNGNGNGGVPAVASSPLLASIAGLSGDGLYRALMALQLPAAAPADVHLEAALAAKRLTLRDRLDSFIDILGAKIGDVPEPEACTRFLAFLDRHMSLDSYIEAHLNLAGAPPPAAS